MIVIDPHAHIVDADFIRGVRAGKYGSALSIEQGPKWELIVTKSVVLNSERVTTMPLPETVYRLDLRLRDMEKMGVGRQILSVHPACMYYGLESQVNREIAATFNESLAKLAKDLPERFSCMATVPLQDPEASAEELARAVRMGHVGVQIGSNVAGRNLDDRALDVFWGKVTDLDVPVFIHPIDVMGIRDRLKDYYLKNLIGNPLDTSVAAACLMFGGVLDRFPKLKIVLAHLGGFVPWIRGRWRHGYDEREEPKMNGARDPETYLSRFYYDTIIHNADCLEFALRTLGSDRILYGTDYPFDMGYLGAALEIPGTSGLSQADKEKIFSSNTRVLYKLP